MCGELLDVDRPPVRPEDVFGLLSHSLRRRTIEYLHATQQGRLTVDEIVSALDDGSSPDLEQDIRTGLRHQHLPRLDRAGLVEYHDSEGIVIPTDRLADPAPVICAAEEFLDAVVDER